MPLRASEIWKRVVKLTGKTLLTYVTAEANTITEVQDTGSLSDVVLIRERNTFPTRQDVVAAYQLLETQGCLCRATDLAWLASPEKKTSSIVFRIVGEIVGEDAKLTTKGPETLVLKRLSD